MIRTDPEHKRSLEILAGVPTTLQLYDQELRRKYKNDRDVEFLVNEQRRFFDDIQYEVDEYEKLRSGGLRAISKSWPIGKQLIAARIALRLTQRELARRLGVDESQVSRDERNDYHGITMDRVQRIQEAMGIEAQITYRMASAPSPLAEAIAASKPVAPARKRDAAKPVPEAAPSRKRIAKQD